MTACSAKMPTLSIPVSRLATPEGCAYVWLVVRHTLCESTEPSENDTCELFLYFSTKPFGTANREPSVFSTCALGRFRGASGWYGTSFFSPCFRFGFIKLIFTKGREIGMDHPSRRCVLLLRAKPWQHLKQTVYDLTTAHGFFTINP